MFQSFLAWLHTVAMSFVNLGAPSLLEYLIIGGCLSYVVLMAPKPKKKGASKAKEKRNGTGQEKGKGGEGRVRVS